MSSRAPLLLVLDGNSLLHRAYHAAAAEGFIDDDGRPVWALRGLVGFIARAAAHLRPDALVVAFDCPEQSARRQDYPGYKAHRPDKPADLTEQIAGAPALLRAAARSCHRRTRRTTCWPAAPRMPVAGAGGRC